MNKDLTLGSLFDGSGGFPLGGLLSGITPLWASEVRAVPHRNLGGIWETHRQVMGVNTKPKTRNQIIKWLKVPMPMPQSIRCGAMAWLFPVCFSCFPASHGC